MYEHTSLTPYNLCWEYIVFFDLRVVVYCISKYICIARTRKRKLFLEIFLDFNITCNHDPEYDNERTAIGNKSDLFTITRKSLVIYVIMSTNAFHGYITQRPTKTSLKQLHDEQLSIDGPSSKEQEDAIIDALGGIDELLQNICASDIAIDEERLENLEHIIGNPHIYHHRTVSTKHAIIKNPKTMETHDLQKKSITYEFVDDDMILYKLFNKKRANMIRSILTSNTMLIFLTILLIFRSPILSVSAQYADHDGIFIFMFFFIVLLQASFMIFETGLLLCANIKALKILSTEFVFLLKILYLIQFVVAQIYYDYVYYGEKINIAINVTTGLLATFGLIITMIVDALSISHRIKIFVTVYSLAHFAAQMIDFRRTSFNRDNSYEQSTLVIQSVFGFDPIHVNMVDIAASAAPVLFIFVCGQLFALIFKPDKAVTIRIQLLIIYRDRVSNIWSPQKLKRIKFLLVTVFVFGLMLCGYALVAGWNTILYAYMLFALVMAIILMLIGSVKSLYAMNVLILSIAGALSVDSFLSNTWRPNGIFLYIFLFGLTAIYAMALIESNDFRHGNYASPGNELCDESSDDDVEFPIFDQRNLDIDLDPDVVIGYNEESGTEIVEMNDIGSK